MAGSISAQVWADARSELQVIYNKGLQAYKQRNLAYFMNLESPDFTVKLPSGQVIKKAQWDAQMKRSMAMAKQQNITAINLKLTGVTTKGNQAVATVNTLVSGNIKDPQGKPHKMTSNNVERHTWIKTPKGWRLRMIQPVKASMTMDGKPFNPMAGMTRPPQKR